MIERFLPRVDFENYDDFKRHYRVEIPDGFNFAYDVVDVWAERDPDKPALVWTDDADRERRFSFGDVKRLSDRAANVFRARGIAKGDAVLLILRQRPEVWFSMLALHKIGAIVIPATFQLTPKDIAYRVNAAHVKMLLAVQEDDIVANVNTARADCPTLESVGALADTADAAPPDGWFAFAAELDAASDDWTRPAGPDATTNRDPMLIYFSSGTTGMPKMILHDFDYPLGHLTTAIYWQRVENGGLHLTVADSGWAKFGWGKIYGQWMGGAVLVAYDTTGKFNAPHLLRTMERLKLTTFCAPPTVYRFLNQEDLSQYDLSSIRHAGTAGEPLNPEVYERFKKATGLAICEGFGQSETSVILANFPWFPVKPGSMGKPSPLYEIDLLDEHGHPCEDGIVGTLVIRDTDRAHPTGLFRAYYRDPAATRASWHDGVYSTGDTAWRDADGYFWFVGRNDDLIKCSGYRIGPFEVESALLTHPSVVECAVTAAPDALRGQVVKATIVLAKGYVPSEALKRTLQDHVKTVTAPYKYPRIVEFVDELPKTASGKIRRGEIRTRDHDDRPVL